VQTVSLTLHRFDRPSGRAFALWQMGAARLDMLRRREVGFWKLCGSGRKGGFTLGTDASIWAILATWPDLAMAQAQVTAAQPWARWRGHADETFSLFLAPVSARGRWAGREPFRPEPAAAAAPAAGPIAALTRASIRPSRLVAFWRRSPDITRVLDGDPSVLLRIGLGEVPVLRQITFSVWPDSTAMAAFARGDGAHGRAIRAVREGGWFSEELYARFHVLGTSGTWGGTDPLRRPGLAA
jgi:spheroidene monooxygenase